MSCVHAYISSSLKELVNLCSFFRWQKVLWRNISWQRDPENADGTPEPDGWVRCPGAGQDDHGHQPPRHTGPSPAATRTSGQKDRWGIYLEPIVLVTLWTFYGHFGTSCFGLLLAFNRHFGTGHFGLLLAFNTLWNRPFWSAFGWFLCNKSCVDVFDLAIRISISQILITRSNANQEVFCSCLICSVCESHCVSEWV